MLYEVITNDIELAPGKATGIKTTGKGGETLVLNATAKTFRYLDEEELAEQRRAASKKGRKR